MTVEHNQPKEIWRNIKGFENYRISNYGNVKNINTNRLLLPNRVKNSLYIHLSNNNGTTAFLVDDVMIACGFKSHKEVPYEFKYDSRDEFIYKSY